MTISPGQPLEIVLRVTRTEETEALQKEIAFLKSRISTLETENRDSIVIRGQNLQYYDDLKEAYYRMRAAGMDIHGITSFDAIMRQENQQKIKRRKNNGL